MPDKDGRAVRGEPGHFRYKKDCAAGNKFNADGKLISTGPPIEPYKAPPGKDTSTATPGLADKVPPKRKGTPDPKGIYTEEVAKGFNKQEQKNLLKARGVAISTKDKEKQLVEKILKSNPEEEEIPPGANPEDKAPKNEAPAPPESAEGTADHLYTEDELGDFKAKKLVEILKGFGEKKIPLSEKGRIKKILELQG